MQLMVMALVEVFFYELNFYIGISVYKVYISP